MNRSIIIFPAALVCICFSFGKYKPPVYDLKYIEKNLVQIPAGSFSTGNDDDIDSERKTLAVKSFYLFNQEISNGFYCSYLYDVKKSDTALYHKALPDTLVWREKLAFNEPYVEYYLRHPAYCDYPLVGVNYEQCLGFCEWLTKKYNALPGRKYNKVKFELPTECEWEYAALGGFQNNIFPWNGYSMQNHEKSFKSDWMANFACIDQSSVVRRDFEVPTVYGTRVNETCLVAHTDHHAGIAGSLSDATDITAPTHSYWPNAYGLYNMAGNVEEMVSEKGISKGGSWRDPGYYLRIQSRETYNHEVSSERGFRVAMKILE